MGCVQAISKARISNAIPESMIEVLISSDVLVIKKKKTNYGCDTTIGIQNEKVNAKLKATFFQQVQQISQDNSNKQIIRYKDSKEIRLLQGHNFITIILHFCNTMILICENRAVHHDEQFGRVFFIDEKQHIVREGTLKEDKFWQIDHVEGFQQRQYPPGINCNRCGSSLVCAQWCQNWRQTFKLYACSVPPIQDEGLNAQNVQQKCQNLEKKRQQQHQISQKSVQKILKQQQQTKSNVNNVQFNYNDRDDDFSQKNKQLEDNKQFEIDSKNNSQKILSLKDNNISPQIIEKDKVHASNKILLQDNYC